MQQRTIFGKHVAQIVDGLSRKKKLNKNTVNSVLDAVMANNAGFCSSSMCGTPKWAFWAKKKEKYNSIKKHVRDAPRDPKRPLKVRFWEPFWEDFMIFFEFSVS